jgi:hypothetical protein
MTQRLQSGQLHADTAAEEPTSSAARAASPAAIEPIAPTERSPGNAAPSHRQPRSWSSLDAASDDDAPDTVRTPPPEAE